MHYAYVVTPFLAWLVAGVTKFAINSLRARRLAFDLIGYGGLPSNHSAIVASMCALIASREGLDSPALGVAVTLAFIVLLDATSLRGHVGRQAAAINRLQGELRGQGGALASLRERIGHTPLEVGCGLIVGVLVGSGTALLP